MISLRALRAAAVLAMTLVPALATAQTRTIDVRGLERWLRRVADSAGFSGVVLVERGGKVVLEHAYTPTGARALTTQSAFWIGSTTKQFTAAAIMRLVDEGKLAVTDSLYHFFRSAPRRARAITIEQLLTHTSGLDAAGAANGIGDRDAAVRAILAEPVRDAPGASYHNAGEDYNVLAAIVEQVSGKPFEAFVERALLIPAGLARTGFCGRMSPNVKLAPSAQRAVPPPCSAGVTPVDWADRGATGLVSTAADLLKWTHAIRSDRLLAAASQRELERGHAFMRPEGDGEMYYGFGARVYMEGQRRREVSLSGYDVRVGHSSAVRVMDSGLTIVVLSNAGLDARGQAWAGEIARRLDGVLNDATTDERTIYQPPSARPSTAPAQTSRRLPLRISTSLTSRPR